MGRTVALSPTDPARILVGGDSAGTAAVFTSRDTGRTWSHSQAGLTGAVRSLESERTSGSLLYCGTDDGAFRSSDTGRTWRNTGLSHVNAIAYMCGWESCAGTDSGVFLNQGGGWWQFSEGLTDSAVVAMAIDASEWLYAGTRQAGLFRGYHPPGIEETPNARLQTSNAATIVHGVLHLPRDMPGWSDNPDRVPRSVLLDAAGRRVLELRVGANDVRSLAPGVYFVQSALDTRRSPVRKVVLTK